MDCVKLVGMNKYAALDLIRQEGYVPRIVKENGKTFSFYDDVANAVLLTVRDTMVIKAELEY